MDSETLEAKNELERKLLAAMSGDLSSDDLMREMLTQQVFIPVRDEKDSGIKGFQRTTKATPLVIEDDEGHRILVVFTSPERAKDFLSGVPDYGGGLLADFAWIVERMEAGFAISVNPGLEMGMDIEPEDVTRMLAVLAADSAKN